MFSHYVAERRSQGPAPDLRRVFAYVETKLTGDDHLLDNAFSTCFLENLMNRVPSSIAPASLVSLLGPKAREFCRGEPTEELLRECQEQVLFLVRDAGRGKVLYDTLEMETPPVDVPWSQRELDEQLGPVQLRRAIVVPNSKLAYLARLAFGEGDYRVFYNDFVGAVRWLSDEA